MLTPSEYRAEDATGLAALVRKGDVSALELVDLAIAEIERLDPEINAVVAMEADRARAAAASIDPIAPFAGVPFLAKDINVDIAGFRTTHACRFFTDAPIATQDGALVRRWRDAGLIVIGRTNTPEFATEFVCEPDLFGPTLNPWDLARTPGGSSGGAAAAVAAGMVPMAHASDSGGSIRVPAACCGLFGFKPSSGVIATGSRLGPLVGGLNVDHVVTWSVRDSAGMLAATASAEIFATTPHTDPGLAGWGQASEPIHPLTIGVVSASLYGVAPEAEVTAKLVETRSLLEGLGHRTVDWHWPDDVDPVDSAQMFWAAEMAAVIDERAAVLGRQPTEEEMGPIVTWALRKVRSQSAVDMALARQVLTGIQTRMATAMSGVDILMLPVTAEPPIPSGLLRELARTDIDAWAARAGRFAPYTEIFNATGQPAMSVPLHQDKGGLPLAIQFVGRVGGDRKMLDLARSLETALPWAGRRPT